jgi:quercetin dioxygenase-like cupin family protein
MSPNQALDELYKAPIDAPGDAGENISHFFGAGVYARRGRIRKGNVVRFHVHNHDHLSIVAVGSGTLLKENGPVKVNAGDCIEVKAGERHAFEADEDLVFFCIHSGEV